MQDAEIPYEHSVHEVWALSWRCMVAGVIIGMTTILLTWIYGMTPLPGSGIVAEEGMWWGLGICSGSIMIGCLWQAIMDDFVRGQSGKGRYDF